MIILKPINNRIFVLEDTGQIFKCLFSRNINVFGDGRNIFVFKDSLWFQCGFNFILHSKLREARKEKT